MVTLTGFADEISPDLEVQLDVLEQEGIRHLEFRGVWGKNVLKLSDEELARVKERLDERGFKVSSIGSPIGKIRITDDFTPHLEDFRKAVRVAKQFEAPFIRIFSFFVEEGKAEAYREEVIGRLRRLTEIAGEEGVTLLHENEKHIYGDNGERCLDLLSSIASPRLLAAFDPANYVQCSVRPMSDAYPLVEKYIGYIHVKDAVMGSGKVVPAGQGDGELRGLIAALKEKNYQGFMSLEPHLKAAETFQGFSGPELFVVAVRALKELLGEAGIPWK